MVSENSPSPPKIHTDEEASREKMSQLWPTFHHSRSSSLASLATTDVSESVDSEVEEEEDAFTNDSTASDNSSSSIKSNTSSKHVSFAPELILLTHSITLGDTPSCPLLAIQLDWAYDRETLDLEEFESSKTANYRRRRGPKKLLFYERSELLMDVAGFTGKELSEKRKEAKQRMQEEMVAAAKAAEIEMFDGCRY